MKRREVLKSMGAIAGAAGITRLLPGCGDDGTAGGEEGITVLVYLMMENRSYDHVLGARSWLHGLPGDGLSDGLTNPDSGGAPVALFEPGADEMCCPDPPHGWGSSHEQWNNGAMDGFLTTHQQGHPGDLASLQYLTRTHMPATWALADAYASCDRWFASVMGPTWPNRFYWLAGTSMGMQSNDLPEGGFTTPTIFHRLDEASVPWKTYYADLPFMTLLGAQFDVDVSGRLLPIEEFYRDAAAGTLPSVCYLDPAFAYNDDHPPHHPILGQQFIASVYAALAASPQWKNCLLVITYDEHGGFYDHVSPPTVSADEHADRGFLQLGFRVPTVVAGPYVKQGHVSSVVRDHTSALRHIETTFGTAPLSARTTAAADLTELLDLDRLAAGDWREPVALPPVDVDAWTIDAACTGGKRGRTDHDILRISDEHPEWQAAWDRRDRLPETARLIASVLEQHGRGGIRRR